MLLIYYPDFFFVYLGDKKNLVVHCRRIASDSTMKHRPYFIFTSRDRKCLPKVPSLDLSVLTTEDAKSLIKNELVNIRSSNSSWQQEFVNVQTAITTTATASSSYRKNLVITSVPETPGENVVTIVKKLAKQISFTLSGFIDNCFRVGRKKSKDGNAKPSTILLKFTTEMSRDAFIKCYFTYIKKHQLTPRDIDMEGTDRIYVNEHLSPDIQPLLKKALALRREGVISQVAAHCTYLSVKMSVDGRIVWKRIYNENDLLSLCDH